MKIRYQSKSSFEHTIKRLGFERKSKVKEAVRKLVVFFETGEKSKGLGLKKLRGDFWEIRTDLKDRIIFKFKRDLVEFIIVGNHQEVKEYLKNI
ncbi:MAG: hypothetical protein AB1393_01585 [Candidatus Edwardsbacteria bacterium]